MSIRDGSLTILHHSLFARGQEERSWALSSTRNGMPHGGMKQSGYGKDMSLYALEDYSAVRHVMVAHG